MAVIFIAGLGHSGSTFLELVLASHPDAVGLGEIGLQIEKFLLETSSDTGEELCSCGLIMRECKFWGELLAAKHLQDRHIAYDAIFTRFKEMFPGKIAVDSSKGFRHLEQYRGARRADDVRVVLIVRDYRGWALSRSKTNQRKDRRDLGYVLGCYHWMIANLVLIWRLSRTPGYVYVAYEDLVFSPQDVLPGICKILGLSYYESMMEMDALAHNVLGNRMKSDSQKNRHIWYDHGWMMDPRVALLAPLVFPVHLYQVLQQWWLKRRGRERRLQRSMEVS
jgi:hypothetical protein